MLSMCFLKVTIKGDKETVQHLTLQGSDLLLKTYAILLGDNVR